MTTKDIATELEINGKIRQNQSFLPTAKCEAKTCTVSKAILTKLRVN